MSNLTEQQKHLIFDYCLGIASQEESAQAQELIFSNSHAAQLHSKLKAAFGPLELLNSADPVSCPDELAEKTIAALKTAAADGHKKLENLIAFEQIKPVGGKSNLWRYFGRIMTAAAVIFLALGMYWPLKYMRQRSVCQAQLYRIGQGLISYQNDNNGQLPLVASAVGEPWWKVGYQPQSQKNLSNTRHLWLLVKGGYVNACDFVCPGKKGAAAVDISKLSAAALYDFPSRNCISYSFRIRCNKSTEAQQGARQVLIADMNPLFEQLPTDFEHLRLEVDNMLSSLNSNNHSRCGQNVLFNDGSVSFEKKRLAGTDGDDIFTLRDIACYSGTERPASESDDFVAP